MRKVYLFISFFSLSFLLKAQSISLTPISPQIFCSSDIFSYTATWSNAFQNSNIVFYQSTDSSFNPYLGQGDSIDYIHLGGSSSTVPISSSCPKVLGIFIDACGATGQEPKNEYMILSSGQGIKVSNLAIDFSSQNNSSGASNADINIGSASCGFKTPAASLISSLQNGSCNASNVFSAGPNDSIPSDAIILVFTSDSANAGYNINGLCNLNYPVYILQSSCTRSIGAFTNSSNCASGRYRTTTITDLNINCSDNFTYDLCGIFNKDGTYAVRQLGIDTASVTNNGIRKNIVDSCGGLDYSQLNFSADTILKFNLPISFCNTGYHYIKAITNPVRTQPVSNTIKFKLNCVDLNVVPQSATICNGSNAIINISSSDTNAIFSWTVSPGPNIRGATVGTGNIINQLLTNTGSNLDSVTYIITARDSICSITKLVRVYVNSESGLAFTFGTNNTTVCKRDSISLDAGLGYSSYLWNTGETGSKITVKQAGIYWVLVSKNGCRGGDTINVTEIDKFLPFSLGRDTAFCGNFSLQLSSGIPQTSWSRDNVQFTTAASTVVNQPGTYVARASNSCGSVSDTIIITSVSATGVNLGRDTAICQSTSVILNATTAGSNIQYLWKTGETTPSISVNQSGVFWVSVFNGTCSSTDTILVTLINKPAPISLGNDTSYCGIFSKVLTGGDLNTVWSTGAVGPQITVTSPGAYSAENRNQCGVESDAVVISKLPSPYIYLGRDTAICDSLVLSVDGSFASILWSTGEVSESILVSSAGIYSVNVFDNVCSASDTIQISKECFYDIYLPTGFSPNGDNLNDILVPLSIEDGMQIIDFLIFDRWGEKLFDSHSFIPGDATKGWDGKFKGKESPLDVYVFTCTAKMPDDKIKSYKGTVSLVR